MLARLAVRLALDVGQEPVLTQDGDLVVLDSPLGVDLRGAVLAADVGVACVDGEVIAVADEVRKIVV